MEVSVKKLIGWDAVLRSARTTVGKDDTEKEPSDDFKKSIIISEHSPIRALTFEVIWHSIPYWVSTHLRTHHIGFKSVEDDVYFIETSRSDRKQINRDELSQTAPVICRVILNAQSIINVSRVRLCRLASRETREAWEAFIEELSKIEPIIASACQPNCIYRIKCPEGKNCCGFEKTKKYTDSLIAYSGLFSSGNKVKGSILGSLVLSRYYDTKSGYIKVYLDSGRVTEEHRFVVVNALGRELTYNEVIHHKDNNKKNNSIKNLEVLSRKNHAREHGYKQGQKRVKMVCPGCGNIFDKPKKNTFLSGKTSFTTCSRRCIGIVTGKPKDMRITHVIEEYIRL